MKAILSAKCFCHINSELGSSKILSQANWFTGPDWPFLQWLALSCSKDQVEIGIACFVRNVYHLRGSCASAETNDGGNRVFHFDEPPSALPGRYKKPFLPAEIARK